MEAVLSGKWSLKHELCIRFEEKVLGNFCFQTKIMNADAELTETAIRQLVNSFIIY
jgi:hypothetical protein